MDREKEEELWKLGLLPGLMDMADSEEADENDAEENWYWINQILLNSLILIPNRMVT
jgi:hypothetical protein